MIAHSEVTLLTGLASSWGTRVLSRTQAALVPSVLHACDLVCVCVAAGCV